MLQKSSFVFVAGAGFGFFVAFFVFRSPDYYGYNSIDLYSQETLSEEFSFESANLQRDFNPEDRQKNAQLWNDFNDAFHEG